MVVETALGTYPIALVEGSFRKVGAAIKTLSTLVEKRLLSTIDRSRLAWRVAGHSALTERPLGEMLEIILIPVRIPKPLILEQLQQTLGLSIPDLQAALEQ